MHNTFIYIVTIYNMLSVPIVIYKIDMSLFLGLSRNFQSNNGWEFGMCTVFKVSEIYVKLIAKSYMYVHHFYCDPLS